RAARDGRADRSRRREPPRRARARAGADPALVRRARCAGGALQAGRASRARHAAVRDRARGGAPRSGLRAARAHRRFREGGAPRSLARPRGEAAARRVLGGARARRRTPGGARRRLAGTGRPHRDGARLRAHPRSARRRSSAPPRGRFERAARGGARVKLEFKYAGQSGIVSGLGSSRVAFATNQLREATYFDGELARPLVFREALGALYDVVVSDHQYHPKDRLAFRAWLEAQDAKFLDSLIDGTPA